MTIQEMVYQFKLQAERIDSKKAQGFSLPKIVIALNSGMLNLVKLKYGINNIYRSGFESVTKRTQDLQVLHILSESIKVTDTRDNMAIGNLSDLKHDLLFQTRTRCIASKGDCINQELDCFEQETDDYNNVLRSPFADPNFEWREAPFRISENKIFISYNDFKIHNIVLDYIRYPKNVDIAGYKKFDGTTSEDVNCELPEYLHYEIVDQAVLEFDIWLRNPEYQFAQMKKSINE